MNNKLSNSTCAASVDKVDMVDKVDKVDMVDVESSNIAKIGYKCDKLYVQFKSGSVYEYKSVPQKQYIAIMSASSKGKYLNSQIKGYFDYRRLK